MEMADTRCSGRRELTLVRVQIPPSAPSGFLRGRAAIAEAGCEHDTPAGQYYVPQVFFWLEASDLVNAKRQATSIEVSLRTITGNVVLSIFKLIAGVLAASTAMISDAAESFSDVFGTVIVIMGVRMASKEPDKEHPYGHERFESVAAIIVSIIILATGVGIGWTGITKVLYARESNLAPPGFLALVTAILTIVIKESMYWYVRAGALRADSSVLMAEACHHRSDAISTVGTLVGIVGARMGFPILDPLAGALTSVLIIRTALRIFTDAIGRMTDRSCDDSVVDALRALALSQERVQGVDSIRTRLFGDRIYVDVEISTDREATLGEAHEVAHRVHDALEEHFPKVKHCMVHVNPAEAAPLIRPEPEEGLDGPPDHHRTFPQ